MDTERMREVLARGMGWTPSERMDGTWYVDKDGNPLIRCILWAPWESWSGCGRVIEAMREKGWDEYVWSNPRRTPRVAAFFSKEGAGRFYGRDDDECKARMLAAARALEANDGT